MWQNDQSSVWEKLYTYMEFFVETKEFGLHVATSLYIKKKNQQKSQPHWKDPEPDLILFLSKRYLHCIRLRDFEAL